MPSFDNLMNEEMDLMNKSNIFKVEYDNFRFLPDILKNVSAFPMIVAYENGKKKEEFKEQRTMDNVKKFIKSNTSKSKSSLTPKSKSSSSTKSIKKLKIYKKKVKSM
jgi:hypothetical protein